MPTKTRPHSSLLPALPGVFAVCQLLGGTVCAAGSVPAAARMLALGTLHAVPLEVEPVTGSFGTLLRQYEQALAGSAEAASEVEKLAYLDAFGISPDAESAPEGAPPDRSMLYFEMLEAQLAWLAADSEAYAGVIHRAYEWVVHRPAYEEELAYWRERPTLSFVVLVGCIEDWARRNQPGLMVTAGPATVSINCPYLQTVMLSPEQAGQIREALHLRPPGGKDCHLLAPGAVTVASSGGIHFIAAGSPALREAVAGIR